MKSEIDSQPDPLQTTPVFSAEPGSDSPPGAGHGELRPSPPAPVRRAHPPPQKRTVCDHCRRRRIRCDGQFPCRQCINATLTCKRDHVPRKRGPKRGRGRVINELRAREELDSQRGSRDSSVDFEEVQPSSSTSLPSTPTDISWNRVTSDPRNAAEPKSAFTTDQYQPNSRNYLHLIPQCVDLYYEHIYPIMPLVYMPAIRSMIDRPMSPSEKNLIYALCGLTSMHMSGQSIQTQGRPPSWEAAGRFFLDECISVRHSYDFLEDLTLSAVISSFWLSTSFFEINQSRKSWLYLREALTLALEMGLPDDSTYAGLPSEERICRQRVFWILFVTERSFAILRNKPLTLKKTPALPKSGHPYEASNINSGFLQLISSYIPLDESFVAAWNDGSDPRVSATTYLALQNVLAAPPSFLARSRSTTPSTDSITSRPGSAGVSLPADDSGTEAAEQPDPTAIQKADLLITQQWLRLVVWQSSFRQGLLSWAAPHESMHFAFPLAIARRTATILHSLPSTAVEVHGMGMFEKIFEIGTWCINVLSACDSAVGAGTPISGVGVGMGHESGFGPLGAGVMGMDFVDGSGDMGVLGVSRMGVAIDPLEFFVKTLSASPNSRVQFADRLLMFAGERPGGMRMALSPALSRPTTPGWDSGSVASWNRGAGGAVIGEVKEEPDTETEGRVEMSNSLRGFDTDPATMGVPGPDTNEGGFNLAGSEGVAGKQDTLHDMPLLSPNMDLGESYQAYGEQSPGSMSRPGDFYMEDTTFQPDPLQKPMDQGMGNAPGGQAYELGNWRR